ncbi:serine/threonine-protein kinase [Polyangium jinanense]|uniref:Protein kinase n=1 Tax=Polyangium jinanense TaxID=2829994 RepID=A0A9X3X6Q4_9BACT|nr:protein kinase [Polyangium jinanense]MDC3959905.1 protein kinase [Polyangium jinanense]MDC3983785.1 protein kinase [Polyangium jinanense]
MRSGEIVDGRFELESKASSGGMGTIWRAKDLATSEIVALKLLRDPEHGAERFLSEARILARLEHPCIVRHVGHGLTAIGEPYLVMEWLSGEDLATRLARAPLEIDAGLALVRNAAEGLTAAHARGIVHRDIKPSNIFLVGRRVDRIKLLDFGIARASTGSTVLTRSSSVLGTPGYMAPEQARGDEVVGPRADVFSLGCVLFECLAGRPAFQGSHPMALLAKLLLEEPPELAVVRPEVSASVSSLCARMLSKDPSQRPADGAALVAELSAISGTSSSSPSVRSMTPSRLSERERRLLSIVAIAGTARGALDEVRRIAEPLGAFVDTLAGGTILMVLPGVGSPADQAVRAARAALAIRAASSDRTIALVTGRSDLADRLPVGDLVELVALLVDRAREDGRPGVILDEVTRALLDPRFEVQEHAGHAWLLDEHARGEETRTLLGNPSPFVGRERELNTMLDLLQQEFDEQRAQSVLVTAPAGMGKSRLRQELITKLQDKLPNLCLAVGRADAMRSGAAFSVIASALRMLMEIEVGERREVQQEKVSSAVRALLSGEAAERTAPFLGELVGASFPDERNPLLRSARENAPLMAGRIESAWVEFMRAAARKGPTLLVLEDLHWGDGSSVKLVDTTLRELRDEPFAVVAFARPEVHDLFPRIWAERTHEVRLGPLPRRAASALVRAALGDDVDDALVAGLVARSEGNAFYLEELVRAFTEGRSSGGLPETVLGMVEARLAALPPDVRHFLRAASVYGEVFWPNGVRRLLGGRRPVNVDAALDYAVAREFVTRRNSRRFVGEEEYAFRHALLREGAYAMLTERDRALGHGLAGTWLERVGEPDPSVLAMHFERGGQGPRAAYWHARAAQTAMRGNDLQAGVRAVERGLAAGPTDEVATDLWALRARIASASGDYEASLAAAEEALRRTTPGSVAHCIALEGAIGGAMLLGRHETLQDLSRRVLQTEPAPNALSALARALAPLIAALAATGNGDAFLFLEKMRANMGAGIEMEPSRAGALAYASAMVEKNLARNPWLARQHALDAVRLLEQGGERHVVPIVTAVLVGICTDLGAFEEAEVWLDRTEARPPSMAANVVAAYLAQLRLAQGRFEEAITMSRSVAERVHGRDGNVVSVLGSLTLIEAHIERGDVEAAESLIDATSSRGNLIVAASCAWFRSRALLARGRPAEAVKVCREALGLHRQIGPRGVERVLLTLAEALMAAGDVEAAQVTLREAQDELGAREAAIGDPSYRRHFVERVPGNVRIRRLSGTWLGGSSAQ